VVGAAGSAQGGEGRPPLRVAVLLDSFVQPAWVRRMLEEVRRSGCAELALVVHNAAPPPRRRARERLRGLATLVGRLYLALDARWLRTDPDPLAPCDVSDLLAGCARLEVEPRRERRSDWFPDAAVEAIRAERIDVALRLGFRILRGRALEIARHGVWSYHHGDNRVRRGGPAGLWEVLEGEPVTGAVLQILTEELDNGRVIYRSWSATHPWSAQRNRSALYWKSASFVARKLRDLHREGPAALEEPGAEAYLPYAGRLYTMPSNARTVRRLARLVARYLASKVHHALRHEQWFVAWRLERGREGPADSFFRFRPLLPPHDRFWADPCVVHRDGRWYVFFEEYVYREGKGTIALFEVDERGRPGGPERVLAGDHHLSAPCVFEWEGRHYLVPESSAKGAVDLYRAREFPRRWEHERTLLSGLRALDPVLCEHEGRWWLFAAIAPPGGVPDELHLFHAPSPLGPWTPHPRNPVKSDVRGARPAGRPFRHRGRLLRPGQDGSRRYGWAIRIFEVCRLDPEGFEEVEVAMIPPLWREGLLATHTLNFAEGLTVIDGVLDRPRWRG
jgi:hypothetical protein